MASNTPRALIEIAYAEYAREYLRSLPPEHFMEATSQGRQREITLESLALVKPRRPDVHVFNELLVQYPRDGQRRPGQVVPDNMVVLCDKPIKAEGSFDVPLQPEGPFWVLEYVSKNSRRKDYDENFDKYEKELKVPYFLLFYPENQELTLYHHNGTKYLTVHPNDRGRYLIEELELELALLDGWVRYWFRGELLPLPADLQQALDEARRQLAQERQRAEEALRQANEARRREEEARRREEEARQREEEARQREEEATRQATEAGRRAEQEYQARLTLERELAQLRARLQAANPPHDAN